MFIVKIFNDAYFDFRITTFLAQRRGQTRRNECRSKFIESQKYICVSIASINLMFFMHLKYHHHKQP